MRANLQILENVNSKICQHIESKNILTIYSPIQYFQFNYPPASEASREVANLTEIKNPHTLYMVTLGDYIGPKIIIEK